MQILHDEKFVKLTIIQTPKSRRNKVLDGFIEILNPKRIEQGFKPLSYSRLAFLLKEFDDWGKSIFLGSCRDAQNPSAYFWWKLKQKKSFPQVAH